MNWKKYWPYLLLALLLLFAVVSGPVILAGYRYRTISAVDKIVVKPVWISLGIILLLVFTSYSRVVFYGKPLFKGHLWVLYNFLFLFFAGASVTRNCVLALNSVKTVRERQELIFIQQVWDYKDELFVFSLTKGHDDIIERKSIPETLWPKLKRGDTLLVRIRTGWLGYERIAELRDYRAGPDSLSQKFPD